MFYFRYSEIVVFTFFRFAGHPHHFYGIERRRRAVAVSGRLATMVGLELLGVVYTLTASHPSRPNSFNTAYTCSALAPNAPPTVRTRYSHCTVCSVISISISPNPWFHVKQ
jgi:hypothetical protein